MAVTQIHSRCVQIHISDVCREAVSVFSTKSSKGDVPLVLIPTPRPALSIMMQVPSGVTCLLQKFGMDVGEAEPGLHLKPSYFRIAYVVTQQSCTYDAPIMVCPTSDDVRVNVDVVLVFRISDARKFVYRLGAPNFDEFLSGTVDEAIRMLVRKQTHATVYELRSAKADDMLQMLNDKFMESGVSFEDCKIVSVWLPVTLTGYLETTTMMYQAMSKIQRQQDFEILQINQESEMHIEEIMRRREQVLISEGGRKKRAELEFEQRSVKAEEEGRVGMIEAEGKVQVMHLITSSQLNRKKTELETKRLLEISQAEADSTSVRCKAELEAEKMVIEAGWREEQMVCDAEATKHEAVAEREASVCLVEKRRHELAMRERQILAQFAAKGQFNMVGESGDQLIQAMMSGSISQSLDRE
mmetsp:Transcript_65121/g.187168  ORF Transcript_65121/g.187168 Transcript_65121/m.187168 type:complete len:413 (+) Transcript_65121:3-1241(+)